MESLMGIPQHAGDLKVYCKKKSESSLTHDTCLLNPVESLIVLPSGTTTYLRRDNEGLHGMI